MIRTVCKYTPIELFAGFGRTTLALDAPADAFAASDACAHANLCGFGKSVIEAALAGTVDELVLVNCCDVMRRAYEVIGAHGSTAFLHLMDLPHSDGPCQVEALAKSLRGLARAYERHAKTPFDLAACQAALRANQDGESDRALSGTGVCEGHAPAPPSIALLGVRPGSDLARLVERSFSLPVRNLTCTGNRRLRLSQEVLGTCDEEAFFLAYAKALLGQIPCRRMIDPVGRRALADDPSLRGIVYHTMKFCDYYAPEYAELARSAEVPLLKIESDFTRQSAEQLVTRIEAFAESIGAAAGLPTAGGTAPETAKTGRSHAGAPSRARFYVAGIDSGSTSTDVVILDQDGRIAASMIMPTGAGARKSADDCLAAALRRAHIARGDVISTIATGYGRAYLDANGRSVTEITCHARGAHHLAADVRTVIDIGGQDSKVIRIDGAGNVVSFAMNDKCAAGTGRFLEMMARALQMPLEEMGERGASFKEDITISSMCSVFAESEVVSLVAQNKDTADIVHGINASVAAKIAALAARVGGEPAYLMTGGVAKNAGVVAAIAERLGAEVRTSESSQLCGALGAALIALDDARGALPSRA